MSVAIILRPPGRPWQQVGETGSLRVLPHTLALTADEAGPLNGSFILAAQPRDPAPPLLPFTPIKIDIDGLRVFSGYVRVATVTGHHIAVELTGDQACLDGDPLQIIPADSQLTSWNNALCVDRQWTAMGTQTIGAQAIQIGWASQSGTITTIPGEFNGVTYLVAERAVVAIRVTALFTAPIGARFVVVAHNGLNSPSSGPWLRIIDVPDTTNGVFVAGTGGPFFRFLSMGYTGLPSTIPNGTMLTIPAVTVYDRGSYAAAAGVRGDEIAGRVRELVPQLSRDTSQIHQTSFYIPHLERIVPDVPRSILTEAAGYDDPLVQVDAYSRLVFQPRSPAAVVEFGVATIPTAEAPQDPATLLTAVDVLGQTRGGASLRRRYAVTDDPLWASYPAPAGVANPDFSGGVSGWAPTPNTVLTAGSTSPPPGYSTWALIANSASPGSAWGPGESVLAAISGPMKAGVPYRLEIWLFDASTPPLPSVKVPTIALIVQDANDQQNTVERTLRLPYSSSTPYPWQKFVVTWIPRVDVTAGQVILYNQPDVGTFDDGVLAGNASYPCFTGVKLYTATSLLIAQGQMRVGQVTIGSVASDAVAQAVGVTFLRGAQRLVYTGQRDVPDRAARNAVTGQPLPAAALLGLTGRNARMADRIDPTTGGLGALAYLSAVTYDHSQRRAQVTLGQRYQATQTLLADLAA